MRPGVIDTNVLLYAANEDCSEHVAARRFLEGVLASSETWHVTDGIVYEFLRVATHAKVFPRPLTWQEGLMFLDPLLTSETIGRLGGGDSHWRVLSDVLSALSRPAGNLFFDIRTATLMREHGVRRIYTTDTDFLQFQGIEVIDPLRGANVTDA